CSVVREEVVMGTEESVAWGAYGLLSFILLIAYLRWVGPAEDQNKDAAQLRSGSSDTRSNRYEEELEALGAQARQRPPLPRRRLRPSKSLHRSDDQSSRSITLPSISFARSLRSMHRSKRVAKSLPV